MNWQFLKQEATTMNSSSLIRNLYFSAACILLFATGTQAADEPPAVSADGLHLVPDAKIGAVYIDPEADFSGYTKVQLLDAGVAFKKNWARDQRRDQPRVRITDKDMDKIKNQTANIFNEAVVEVFDDHDGWEITDTAADDVLLFRPAVANLDVTAPDIATPGRSTTFSSSAGSATLYLELYDSVTGDKLAWVASGIVASPRGGYMSISNSVVNSQEARREIKRWATQLQKGLDEVKQHGVPKTE
jgi:hypothetical protein